MKNRIGHLIDSPHKAKLGLGTVQFGTNYGITNTAGKVELDDIREIIAGAALYDVLTIDTAAMYGNSEEVLGLTLPTAQPWEIVTKTMPLTTADGTSLPLYEITSRFEKSLELLRRPTVNAVLVHRASDLLGPEGDALYSTLVMLKYSGRVKKIGVSVYNALEIDAILARYPIDIIQLPFNALDQRLAVSGHLAGLKAAGIEIHVRSVFLQGTLLIDTALLPAHLTELAEPLSALHEKWREKGLDPLGGALNEVVFRSEIDRVIVGVTTAKEWLAIVKAYSQLISSSPTAIPSLHNEQLLDPSQWGHLVTATHGG